MRMATRANGTEPPEAEAQAPPQIILDLATAPVEQLKVVAYDLERAIERLQQQYAQVRARIDEMESRPTVED